MMEVTDYPDYILYEDGSVYGIKRKKFLKPFDDGRGYPKVRLYRNSVKKDFRVHSLVANHYLNNSDKSKEVNHIDGNKYNNHVKNLEWVSHSENIRHAYSTGLNEKTIQSIKSRSSKKVIDLLSGKIFSSAIEAFAHYNYNNVETFRKHLNMNKLKTVKFYKNAR